VLKRRAEIEDAYTASISGRCVQGLTVVDRESGLAIALKSSSPEVELHGSIGAAVRRV